MASIRDLKKDINNVLGDIIEAVYIVEGSQQMEPTKEGSAKAWEATKETSGEAWEASKEG